MEVRRLKACVKYTLLLIIGGLDRGDSSHAGRSAQQGTLDGRADVRVHMIRSSEREFHSLRSEPNMKHQSKSVWNLSNLKQLKAGVAMKQSVFGWG